MDEAAGLVDPLRSSAESLRCEFLAALSARAMLLSQLTLPSRSSDVPPPPLRDLGTSACRRRTSSGQLLLEDLGAHYGTQLFHLAADASAAHRSECKRATQGSSSSTTATTTTPFRPGGGVRWSSAAAARFLCPQCHAVYATRCVPRRCAVPNSRPGDVNGGGVDRPTISQRSVRGVENAMENSDVVLHSSGSKKNPRHICNKCHRLATMVTSTTEEKQKEASSRQGMPSSDKTVAVPAGAAKKTCRRKRFRSRSAVEERPCTSASPQREKVQPRRANVAKGSGQPKGTTVSTAPMKQARAKQVVPRVARPMAPPKTTNFLDALGL